MKSEINVPTGKTRAVIVSPVCLNVSPETYPEATKWIGWFGLVTWRVWRGWMFITPVIGLLIITGCRDTDGMLLGLTLNKEHTHLTLFYDSTLVHS